MKKLAIFVLAIPVYSCDFGYYERGSGDMITEDYNVGSFREVELRGDYEVTLIESNSEKVEIEADDNLMRKIDVDVHGNVLRIESRRIRSWKGIHVNIYYKDLEGIYSGGAVELRARNPIRTKALELTIAGAGEIKLEFEGEKLDMRLSGAGDVELAGYTRDFELTMSGAGGLDAFDLRSEYAKIRISGVGGADIFVTKELDARISGLGDVTYRGNPKFVDKNVSGLGSISQDRRYSDDQ